MRHQLIHLMKLLQVAFRQWVVLLLPLSVIGQKINRKALVARHNVIINKVDTLGSLTVGNGKFAFTVDVTGLQTFPENYANGVPLGTESEWGWHSQPNTANYKYSETLKEFDFAGQPKGLYAVQMKESRQRAAADYFRENPNRLQLGNIGLTLIKRNGKLATLNDLQNIHQQLNLWTGEITSNFTLEGTPVRVITCVHANKDVVAVKIASELLGQHRIKIRIRFPYPTNQFADKAVNYKKAGAAATISTKKESPSTIVFKRTIDSSAYYITVSCKEKTELKQTPDDIYELTPQASNSVDYSFQFSPHKVAGNAPLFDKVSQSSRSGWESFWQSGAAVDFSGCTDGRAFELERRVILSQYLLRVQEAGSSPPQETGLTYNSWYGRPHMEMLWWHTAQFALWGRPALMEKSMQWYFKAFNGAKAIAQRQGYQGVRWQKMTDNAAGESPSNVGSFLIWQQPNIIYEAELLYRDHPSKALLQKYAKLIFATADFMASFAKYNNTSGYFDLGKGYIPAQESYEPSETFNSPYELAYWKWALQIAQRWRLAMGLKLEQRWQKVIDRIAPLYIKNGVYYGAQSVDDSYSPQSKYTVDHPAVLMASALLPPNDMVDSAVMHRTFDIVKKSWHWEHTWGWDFPTVAMAATRIGQPEEAVDALFKNVTTNTFLANGHNYQNKLLTIYLPGNGSLLAAIALMCAGADKQTVAEPGFPKNGKWKVKWEGLKALP